VASYVYAFPLDRLVQRFKFAGDLAVGRWLGQRLAHRVRKDTRPDLLLAPPLAIARLRERGFNQAYELAKTVGRALDLPVARRGLARRRDTAPQPGLGRTARRANLAGAFECRLDLRGRRVAIVDDVLTTGATADALGDTLRRAGADAVQVWVVARTPEPGT
jgi:ComF family protein